MVVATSLLKYFNFLRAVRSLSYLIFMLENVTIALTPFFLFHGILIIMIATMMCICESSIIEVNKTYKKLPHFGQRIINSLRLT